MLTRTLGRSGIPISAMGLGCWAIGGPYSTPDGKPCGWGDIDDDQSIRAIHHGLELGVNLLDTAACYGCGHSERVVGKALAGRRDEVIIATKFGHTFNERERVTEGTCNDEASIVRSCEESLRRLGTDRIDLFQFHQGRFDADQAGPIRDACEKLVEQGKVRTYGWSTDAPERAAVFAQGPNCSAIQQRLSLFEGNHETLRLCERENLASLNRGPLIKGLLTGKFTHDSTFPDNDVRSPWWNLRDGREGQWLERLEKLKDALTADGRSLAQGALGWLWSLSPVTVPIPGFKTLDQVEENAKAMDFGPLPDEQATRIRELLEASPAH